MPTRYCIPPTLTDPVVLFQNLGAANVFFGRFALPAAEPGSPGVMEQADSVSYTVDAYSTAYYDLEILNEDLTTTTVQLPSKADYDNLKTRFETLASAFNSLLTNLKSAGIVED